MLFLIWSLDCSAVVVTLKNELLDNGYGFLQGTYLRSTGVNGKLSWINGDYAIWFTPNNWIIGDLSSIGSSNAYIYANIDTTDVTADEIQWNYWTGNVWKLAPNDISVTCNDAKGTVWQYRLWSFQTGGTKLESTFFLFQNFPISLSDF